MRIKVFLIALSATIAVSQSLPAQENGKLFFTTAFGVVNTQGKFSNAFKSTLAFNSGVEMSLKKNWFGQLVFDFNALKYDQQVRDANSPFLFQNTNSSLLLLGLNGGKNINFNNHNWFTSVYAGGGFLNIGEPRVTVNTNTGIAKQDVARASNVFARTGLRLAYTTQSKFFQTLYLDGSYWASPARVQGGQVKGFSFYIGTRFGTVQ